MSRFGTATQWRPLSEQLESRYDDDKSSDDIFDSTPSAWPTALASPVFETISVINKTGHGPTRHSMKIASPPRDADQLTQLPTLSWEKMLREIKRGEIMQVCTIVSERPEGAEPKSAREERFAAQS